MSLLDVALTYARQGWPVFPLWWPVDGPKRCACPDAECGTPDPQKPGELLGSPGKHPCGHLVPHGLKDATTDEAQVRAWWVAEPRANIGVATGVAFDVCDLDDDAAVGRFAERCTAAGIDARSFPRASTGGGGRHVLVAPTGLGNRARFLPGTDWRGAGGYIVAPGSIHPSGQAYAWLRKPDGPLPPCPAWLLEALSPPSPQEPAAGPHATSRGAAAGPRDQYVAAALEAEVAALRTSQAGERNDTLNRAAFALGQMVGAGWIPAGRAQAELLAAALAVGLSQREAEQTIRSGLSSGEKQPRQPPDDELATLAGRPTGSVPAAAAPAPPAGPEDGGQLAPIPEYPATVLPRGMRAFVEAAAAAGLPAALAAGAALAAVAAAVGPAASIEAESSWTERAILWVPLLAPRGAGKSPCQGLAFGPLRDHDAQVWGPWRQELDAWYGAPAKDRGARPVDPSLLMGDVTVEALARRLQDRGDVCLDVDELQQTISGFGEYKQHGGGDRGRFLSLWAGHPWRYTRVAGGRAGVDILIPQPTVVICGGLQPPLHHLLGGEEDGLRPRWLPHVAAMPGREPQGASAMVEPWLRLLGGSLLPARDYVRRWSLPARARAALHGYQQRWKSQARNGENASTSAALVKADVQLLRVALTIAEADRPATGGEVTSEQVERAAAIIGFSLDCWRALPEVAGLSLSRRDEKLDQHVDRLRDWLEQHGGEATRRDLLRSTVAGVRTAADLDELLRRYAAIYPGVVVERPARSTSGVGRPGIIVTAPRRRYLSAGADNADKFPAGGAAEGPGRPEFVSREALTNGLSAPGEGPESLSALTNTPNSQIPENGENLSPSEYESPSDLSADRGFVSTLSAGSADKTKGAVAIARARLLTNSAAMGADILASLRARGLRVRLAADGRVMASPASRLEEEDRSLLVSERDAIVAALREEAS